MAPTFNLLQKKLAVLIRLLPFMFIVSMACQSGKIDGPKVRDGGMQRSKPKRFQESAAMLWARHPQKYAAKPNAKDHGRYRDGKKNNGFGYQEINTVSQEEWDCPRPGAGKYMPHAVKKNIRNNLAMINSELDIENDSLRTVSEVALFEIKLSAKRKTGMIVKK